MDKGIEENLLSFFKEHRLIKYKKGENLYRPGDIFHDVSFVKSGYVRLYFISPEGKDLTLDFFKPLFYLSFFYSLTQSESRYYFEALSPVEVYKAPKKDFIEFLDKNPQINLPLYTNIAKLAQDIFLNVENIVTNNAYRKVANTLYNLSSKLGVRKNGHVLIDLALTHRIIASLAGLTRETASLQIKRLEREAIISQESRQIIIKDPQKLAQLADLS